ncbi:MAG: Hsp33 family molecular chaperone HslO [Erysipelotrichaceae bacterium]|nr:Hsp33 family molecular chaperone HslO [Erysipelotrichaceae bacterium]
MTDKLVKGLIRNKKVRVYLCKTTDLCELARVKHDLWPTSLAALGRVLSVTAILGGMLKNDDEKVTVHINGNGPIGTIMTDGYKDGHVRGFVGDPHLMLVDNHTNKLAVGVIVGKDGYLRVIKDTGLKDDFAGTVKLISGEIGEDFAYYFTVSEQIPTAVSVGVLVDEKNSVIAAGALVIQMMPDANEDDIVYSEELIKDIGSISQQILNQQDVSKLAIKLFKDIEILEETELSFRCDCSLEKMYSALITLSSKDIQDMIDQDHGCEIVCQYCGKKYRFSEEQLKGIIASKNV